jgi:hypothetical protein
MRILDFQCPFLAKLGGEILIVFAGEANFRKRILPTSIFLAYLHISGYPGIRKFDSHPVNVLCGLDGKIYVS